MAGLTIRRTIGEPFDATRLVLSIELKDAPPTEDYIALIEAIEVIAGTVEASNER